ncbi:tRNA dihydrouridine(20/20a) synthase DusA [Shewanella sp. 1_MG-2023]|uniref:tRNA dihydrouridine(20/20a) synthase DusA n=1 Tax=unclassified Shewanella TaxID=196818 RepID=UPI0026E4918C|nr:MULTISPECIES: tRNA dihydrouridine(20/20a) synthase DusA [unclassified Shewanella]MDO6613466.1 tRNA dihydrouridine(20/20a) synthase DusA [Shewanella sp. 7_MG-2023]MDO6773296.1 tRNA dihydrouridine(20/20a) synthase DusA [Shewanella sp. 2_MG-2023]MDO6795947.1 tRNA dihydrouridine(20/20a) synthase DusA [Shewanella sp. 1_MG-2023]
MKKKSIKPMDRKISLAPMLDWTDRHYRYFARLMSAHTVLYTEMVTTGAIIHGQGDYLAYNQEEHPVALQLGGSNPKDLATCAKLAFERGYDEINLNVGCPSDRVQNGRFGACLMGEPALVAECVDAMKQVADIPVTVKTRIGIDEQDSYEFLTDFVDTVKAVGCDTFIVHARKAWLQGLSPKENREIPELNYERVYQLKRDYADLNISINGGVKTLEDSLSHLQQLDGVMIGREAYQNPYLLAKVDQLIYGEEKPVITREQVIEQMMPYIEQHLKDGGRLNHITRHMIGLFQGLPGSRGWRRHLSENAHKAGAGVSVIWDAVARMEQSRPPADVTFYPNNNV